MSSVSSFLRFAPHNNKYRIIVLAIFDLIIERLRKAGRRFGRVPFCLPPWQFFTPVVVYFRGFMNLWSTALFFCFASDSRFSQRALVRFFCAVVQFFIAAFTVSSIIFSRHFCVRLYPRIYQIFHVLFFMVCPECTISNIVRVNITIGFLSSKFR